MTRVLLVEDDMLLAGQMVDLLQGHGYDVYHATHAIDAIAAIDAKPPDVIVLDVFLAAATGIALLHELQSYSDTAATPVILCTTAASAISHDDLLAYGVRAVLDKATMRPNDLVAAVRKVLA